MKSTSSILLSLIATLSSSLLVSAHGIVQDIKLDGKLIKGNRIDGNNFHDTSIRQVFSQDPIKGAKNKNINCGTGAKPAALVLDANPGSKLEFNWRAANGDPWPHNTGPMLTYMASCGDQSCDKFDPAKAKWFKIAQEGRKQNGNWVQEDVKNGKFTPPVTIPANLAPGNYLVRHEIIALHLANTMGGAEFYAGCTQLRLGGSGTGAPSPDELVSLPGAYSDNDPGIFVPDVFNPGSKYVFPGPKVSKLAATATSNNGGSGSGEGEGEGDKGKEEGEKKKGGSCRLKVNKDKGEQGNQQEAMEYQPRRRSRVMRDVKFH